MFHANKWGWKRLAANLLLIPVLTGGSAVVAHAQFGSGQGMSGPAPAIGTSAARTPGSGTPATGDPKMMLKEGRKALAAGLFDRAQDLARAAEANNPTGKWGLFDDTPNALLKDIQSAVVKAQKAQGTQLVKQAKALFAKPAANDAERAANLDQAMHMAQRADQLHGPYSAWDLGDRPDKLFKEIQTARARIRTVPMTPAPATTVAGNHAQQNSTFQPAGGIGAPQNNMPARPGANDPRKSAAVQLMTEGKKLADQGNFAAARSKYMEADRVGAHFDVRDYTPSFAMQELNTRGQGAIDKLLAEARSQMGKKDYPRAEAALNAASDIAGSLGLFPRPVEEAKAQLRSASNGKFGITATPGIVSIGKDTLVPIGPGASPVGPIGPASPVNPTFAPGTAAVGGPAAPAPKSTAPVAGNATGRQLLDQARVEFSKGDFEMAEKLAQQAHNLGGAQEEARGLLNTIDAERLKLKTISAGRSFTAAQAAFGNRDYNHALNVLLLIDPNLLSPEDKGKRTDMLAACKQELDKSGTAVATTGGMQPSLPSLPMGGTEPPVTPGVTAPPLTPPGNAQAGTNPQTPGGADNVTNQVEAMKRVQFQKMRSDGLKIQADAQAAFGRGETDLGIQMLVDYTNRVRTSGLEPSSIALLLRPIDSRLEMFRVMKGQIDGIARVNNEARDAKAMITGRGAAEEQRKAEVAVLVRKYHDLVKKSEFAAAEKVAMQAKQLDPDDPAISALAHMAKINKRVKEQEQLKDAKERMVYQGLTDAEQPGPSVSIDDPVYIKLEAMRRAQRRGSLDSSFIKTRTPAEFDIEVKLDKPISIEFSQTPLDQAVENLKDLTKLPLVIDYATLDAEGISAVKPVTVKPGAAVSTRNLLAFTLEQAGLSFVVEHDLVKVTSTKKAKGRLYTKVFSVADLVTPVPNFALPDYANFDKMLNKSALNSGNVHIQGLNGGGVTPQSPVGGLGGGTQASYPAATTPGLTPGISGGTTLGQGGGRLETNQWSPPNPLGASANLAGERNTKHEQLIKLITGMVKPYSWDGMGGPGRIEYYDIGSALVVNQVADVIQEVADLLEALRRLQDLAIAVELRIVSLSETWYERMGVDFSMNIKTHATQFEPALTSGTFRPVPYINDINVQGVTVGLTPAGTFTGDLDVPIRPNTFNRAIPPFGGYPNTPGDNGGVALGLAFLNDIQVYMFMEAAQGDRRVNVMQAPKLTLFNGQTSTMTVNDTQFFVTSVTVISVNGQLVFIPNNTPLPGTPDTNFAITIQGVVSADRRFVRLNLPVTMAAQSGAVTPLFPITTFVTPVFEGGSQGQPIPFTQFLQQPSFTTLNINTTVVCPDGGTVLLGGLKTLSEGRNEFGPPFLSKIPYLNRLFKNVGIGRETRHVMIMVTPRIIINSEEEIFQTEGRPPTIQP